MVEPSHTEINRSVGRLEGRMDALERLVTDGFRRIEGMLTEALKEHKENTEDHDGRLRKVEETQSEQRGAWKTICIIGGIAGVAAGLVGSLVGVLFGG
jgi:hypothetical protein